MKKYIHTGIRRFVAMLIATAMMFTSSAVAFATEVNDINDINNINEPSTELKPISECSEITREEALKILELTEEELGDAELFVSYQKVSITSEDATIVLQPGEGADLGSITFTGSSSGSTILAFNAKQAKFGIAWQWLNPTENNAILYVDLLCGWREGEIFAFGGSGWGNGGVNTFSSDWGNVSPDYAYHFVYRTRYSYTVESFPPIQAWVAVIVAAA